MLLVDLGTTRVLGGDTFSRLFSLDGGIISLLVDLGTTWGLGVGPSHFWWSRVLPEGWEGVPFRFWLIWVPRFVHLRWGGVTT